MTDSTPACICGHPESDHYDELCLECQREDGRCTCDELWGGLDPFNGCRVCLNCEAYAAPKPPPPPVVDPNQIALFSA